MKNNTVQTNFVCKEPTEPIDIIIVSYKGNSEPMCPHAKKDSVFDGIPCRITKKICPFSSYIESVGFSGPYN